MLVHLLSWWIHKSNLGSSNRTKPQNTREILKVDIKSLVSMPKDIIRALCIKMQTISMLLLTKPNLRHLSRIKQRLLKQVLNIKLTLVNRHLCHRQHQKKSFRRIRDGIQQNLKWLIKTLMMSWLRSDLLRLTTKKQWRVSRKKTLIAK